MIRTGDSWEISIDKDGVNWSSPDQTIDKSFSVSLEELDRIETHTFKTGKSVSVRHFLYTRSGVGHRLTNASGIKIKHVIAELERLDVPHVKVNLDRQRREERAAAKRSEANSSSHQEAAYHA